MKVSYIRWAFVLLASLSAFMLLAAAGAHAGERGQVIVELAHHDSGGHSYPLEHPGRSIGNTGGRTTQLYKFQRSREGKDFSYTVYNLIPSYNYRVELSFVEFEYDSSGKRVFNVYAQGNRLMDRLDIFTMARGRNRAYQRTFDISSDASGVMNIRFTSRKEGGRGNATVSTIRIYRESGADVVEVSGSASRNRMALPLRHRNNDRQNTFEALLGRMGSRISLNLIPHRLAGRFSSLGTGTTDMQDLVLAVNSGDSIRCLPFTDRYPVWEEITQRQRMTAQEFTSSSPEMPFEVTTGFTAPFYPEDRKFSGAPFFYLDVTVKNTSRQAADGKFWLAFPHKRTFGSSAIRPFETGDAGGFRFSNLYSYYDESITRAGNTAAFEALAVPAAVAPEVEFRGLDEDGFTDFSGSSIWEFSSPAGYPKTYNNPREPLFSYYPRGFLGALWDFGSIDPGRSRTMRFVLAGYLPGNTLNVENRSYSDSTFRFHYTRDFEDVQQVVDYAFASADEILEKASFFDSTISNDSFFQASPAYLGQVRNLIIYTFQSFIANTWWSFSEQGREWFSIWEGTCCRFHGSVDAEYNQAWFYYHFWPELMKVYLDQWLLYTRVNREGTYVAHDMGWGNQATGQAYPDDMPVEENANFILMMYKYWKTTGDDSYVKRRSGTVEKLVDFLVNCDTNGNGLPNLHTLNTVDQGSWELQKSADQTYLGIKCLAAYQAAARMALLAGNREFAAKCRGQVELINQTMEQDLWLSDHFAVNLDGRSNRKGREAYSIYTANGLLYLMSAGRPGAVTSTNLERLREDMVNASGRTMREYGSTHTTFDPYNQWVSQNLWRDQLAGYLGVDIDGANPLRMSRRYWALSLLFARNLNGAFWDVVIYPGGKGASGPSAMMDGGQRVVFPEDSGEQGLKTAQDSDPGSLPGQVHDPVPPEEGHPAYEAASISLAQSLGYYPRGVVSLGLVDSLAGLSLDVPGKALYYQPSAHGSIRVPVFSLADWSAGDPSARVPVIYFDGSSGPPEITNRHLLPSAVGPGNSEEIKDITRPAHAISPDGDGVNDRARVSYRLPFASRVETSLWEGSRKVRSYPSGNLPAGVATLEWDGEDNHGKVVPDGIYTARIDATPGERAHHILPASRELWVNRSVPNLSREWYLAEGFTGSNQLVGRFETYLVVQNPDPVPARLDVTFMLPGGVTREHQFTAGPKSRFTIAAGDILPDAEFSTRISSDRNIAVERAMYWNNRRAGHASIGVTGPGTEWYLAEGYTAEGFNEYVLIQNPGGEQASITATFMTPGAGNVTRKYTVDPHSRFTIHVNDVLPGMEVATAIESSRPVVVERAQYLNHMTAGTCSIAAASTSRTWYLAEGYTDGGFEEYVVVQNPGDTDNSITVTFMEPSGRNTLRNYDLPPECRFTIGVNNEVPGAEVSVKVKAQHPVLVERAMYWNQRSDGHAFIATPTPDTRWHLAEGYTSQGFETWITVQNPGDDQRKLEFTFMEPSGRNTVRTFTMDPRSRFTLGMADILPDTEASATVDADGPIIVERSVYFNQRAGGTCSLGIRGYEAGE